MNDIKYIKRYTLFDRLALVFDLIAVIVYVTIFVILFNAIEVPSRTEIIEPGFQFEGLNLSILAILTLIATPLLFIDVKAHFARTDLDYNNWLAGNAFVKGVISGLLLNPISAIIRFYNVHNALRYTSDKSYLYATKVLWGNLKNGISKLKRKKVDEQSVENQDLSEEQVKEEARLKKQLRTQTIRKVLKTTGLYLFIVIMAMFVFIPFYWMMLTSLKTYTQTQAQTPAMFIPLNDFQWVNYKYVLSEMQFGLFITNTLIVGVISTIGTVVTTILASFAFARIEFKGRETLFSILLMTMMIPGELYIITNFITVTNLGWVSAEGIFLAMIIPFMTSVFYIFFLRQTFKQVPHSLYQAAKVDGCSDFKYLMRVMIPIAGPTIFTITILSVIGSWNAFIWPRLLSRLVPDGQRFSLISVALYDMNFMDEGGVRVLYNIQIAATALVTVPLIIVFLALRKYIIRGVGRSGIKG